MRKKLKELNLSVGNTPNVFPSIGAGRSADSTFSSYMSRTFTDEDKFSEEEEMEDNILRKRIKVNGAYNLDKTLERIDEFLDVGDVAGDALASLGGAGKYVKNLGKSLIGGIPIVDVIFGSYRLSKMAEAIRNFSEKISEKMGQSKGYFGDCLKADSDTKWKNLIKDYAMLTQKDKKTAEEVNDLFNQVLENLKDFVITLIESYDTIAETVITLPASMGTLTLPAIAFGNIGTGIAGFTARSVPFERVLFAGGGYIAEGLKTILDLFLGNSKESKALEQIGEEDNTILDMKQKFKEMEDKGGSAMSAFLFSPVETLARLNEFYRTTGDPSAYLDAFKKMITERKKHSILFLLKEFDESKEAKPDFLDLDKDGDKKEPMKKAAKDAKKKNEMHHNDEESFDEIDLEEYSSVGGGSIQGFSLPLGKKPPKMNELEKAINEQRERIAILQAYHQKTTNRLK